jgi:uncharacterized membrane protein YfcA
MIATALFILFLGISFFITNSTGISSSQKIVPYWKIVLVAVVVGLLSGLLANGGGVLFGPLFIRFFKMPTKKALASSLLVSAGLAIPGTIAHWYLGHINWIIVLLLSIGSIPFSYFGAKVAIRTNNVRLEKIFGIMLILFGSFDLVYSIIQK